jgi:hypothetical protein
MSEGASDNAFQALLEEFKEAGQNLYLTASGAAEVQEKLDASTDPRDVQRLAVGREDAEASYRRASDAHATIGKEIRTQAGRLSIFNLSRIDRRLTEQWADAAMDYLQRQAPYARLYCRDRRHHDPLTGERCAICNTKIEDHGKGVLEEAVALLIRPATRERPIDVDLIDFIGQLFAEKAITEAMRDLCMATLEGVLVHFPRLPLPNASTTTDEKGLVLGLTWGAAMKDDCPYVHYAFHEDGHCEIYAPDFRPAIVENGWWSADQFLEMLHGPLRRAKFV